MNSAKNIFVVGASAGGLEPLQTLVKELPQDFPGTVFVVMHFPQTAISELHHILDRKSGMTVLNAEDGQTIENGIIYCAPSNRHMLIENDQVILSQGPKENRFRPSIDALFRSAAYTYRERVTGVILSGMLNDGTSGMYTIKRFQGISMTQSPESAQFESMPLSVHRYVDVDYTAPPEEIGREMIRISSIPAAFTKQPQPDEKYIEQVQMEVEIAKNRNALEIGVFDQGEFTPLTCPDCEGALVQMPDEKMLRFRCHTGHAFTADTLLAGISENIERDLYKAMRRMEEGTFVLNRIGQQMSDINLSARAEDFIARAEVLRQQSKKIHNMINHTDVLSKAKIQRDEDSLRAGG